MEGCVWGDNQGGSWDVHTIQTAWRAVCGGTSREDPGMSIQSRQHEGCLWGDIQGGSWDVLGILQTAWTPAGNTGQPLHLNRAW